MREAQHGTDSGYYRHRRDYRWSDEPCEECRLAHADAEHDRTQSLKQGRPPGRRVKSQFDPEAVAQRVLDREQAAPPAPASHGPLLHGDGPVRTGCGSDATHVPLPVKVVPRDLFDRLAEAEERRRVRSPFGDHPATVADPRNADLYRAPVDDPDRYAAPGIDDDLWDDTTPPPAEESPLPPTDALESTAPVAAPDATDAGVTAAANASSLSKPPTAPGSSSPTTAPATAGCAEGCGALLTGGGAPRGWILIRIIGAGAPRRYCTPACARAALPDDPAAPVAQRPDTSPRPQRTAQRRQPRTTLDVTEIIRLYVTGAEAAAIAAQLGASRAVVFRILKENNVPLHQPLRTVTLTPDGRERLRAASVRRATTGVDYDPPVVRAWALGNGIDCPTNGRYLPAAVVDAYRAAHPEVVAS